jgi:hypothetical protein
VPGAARVRTSGRASRRAQVAPTARFIATQGAAKLLAKLVGIIAQADGARNYDKEKVGDLVGAIPGGRLAAGMSSRPGRAGMTPHVMDGA